ncbi:hypothetical protein [Streptomyces mobaraensis]|uniref:Uncharacterized protein n=1 Tax=Streptomyces mobaraensis TaxID=35621 RepID=A0A5N5VZ01_STRMB|nr:hypothetical protein [Streptomyces mobaraensis]KAB7834078.1 hypothetical protein FRZ00_30935 [Streptomyces mobaraensis]
MLSAETRQVVIGAVVIALSLSGLALLIMWRTLPNPHRACMPAPLHAPGQRYRCYCYADPITVLVLPDDAEVVIPPAHHARPSRLTALRLRLWSARRRGGGRNRPGVHIPHR